ncbi:MAG: winged helix-turn-helix domain-containing protein [Dehalococcoidia bacterium]
MAFIIVKKGDAEDIGKIFTLRQAATVIGRRTPQYKPDIELNDEAVSRRHVEILEKEGRYQIRDLGSTNGTVLNDDRIIAGRLYDLKHNCKIGLGMAAGPAHSLLIFKETESTNLLGGQAGIGRKTVATDVSWLKIDEAKKEVHVDGKSVKLSRKEYELLNYLYENAGVVCLRDDIIKSVWFDSLDPAAISDATLDQLVHRLREKIEPDTSNPCRIISRKAFGYMLV